MIAPDGTTFVTRFSSAELNYVTRWILYNGEQQVAAFALPATCRPEGYLAAQRNGTLIQVAPQQTRTLQSPQELNNHLRPEQRRAYR